MVRSLNNPYDATTIMNACKVILPQQTALASMSDSGTGQERVFIEDVEGLMNSPMPAVHITPGLLQTNIAGQRAFDGTVQIRVRYYDRWDNTVVTMSSIRQQSYQDLARMLANVESNNSLINGNASSAMSVPSMTIADDAVLDEELGNSFVYREALLNINVLPYLA